ncbi:MAG: UDP-N-acetylmuramate dehydrogenase [Bacilli bacterium]|nr:UDP-N-acetylmuramate dehydrogenase [Bacilli bacterium]
MKDFFTEVEKNNIGKIEKEVFLSKYTTYKVGGLTKGIIYPKNVEKLVLLIKLLKKYKLKYKVIGNGSNLLFSDKKYDGIIIRLSNLDDIEVKGTKITVGAGYQLMRLCSVATKHSLTGLEFASGIPGTVGGAVFMNAGAYKSDMGYIVKEVKVLTPQNEIISLANSEMNFHYRTSFLQKHPKYICLEVTIKLKKGEKSAIEKVIKDRKKRRLETQPLEFPSAGSVFRNPSPDNPAGKIIEELGLKGTSKGGAEVSTKHANFIINKGGASATDIKELIAYIQKRVKDSKGIDLKVEQEFVNWE